MNPAFGSAGAYVGARNLKSALGLIPVVDATERIIVTPRFGTADPGNQIFVSTELVTREVVHVFARVCLYGAWETVYI